MEDSIVGVVRTLLDMEPQAIPAHTVSRTSWILAAMELSKIVAALALVFAGVLVGEYSRAAEPPAGRERLAAREAARRVAIVQHKRHREDFARLCAKSLMSKPELEACRAAYRRL